VRAPAIVPAGLLTILSLVAAGRGARCPDAGMPATMPAEAICSPNEERERVEHFVLERPRKEALAPELSRGAHGEVRKDGALALVEWRRREAADGWQLELDVWYPLEDVRVMVVECFARAGPSVVWREVSRGAGRTLLGEWSTDGAALRTIEWGPDGSVRQRLPARDGAVLPLHLVELARIGRVSEGEFEVFDPLARALEQEHLSTAWIQGPEGDAFERTVELRRADGSLAGSYRFRGEELIEFRWQDGPDRARRIAPAEYHRRSERYGRGG